MSNRIVFTVALATMATIERTYEVLEDGYNEDFTGALCNDCTPTGEAAPAF